VNPFHSWTEIRASSLTTILGVAAECGPEEQQGKTVHKMPLLASQVGYNAPANPRKTRLGGREDLLILAQVLSMENVNHNCAAYNFKLAISMFQEK